MTVYFHGSFGLNRERMAALLATAKKKRGASDSELAAPFGYGAEYTRRYRSWLHKTGIIDKGRAFTLTPVGGVVLAKDPKFEHRVTQCVMHHELSTDSDRAEAWHYFVHEFLPKNEFFSRQELEDGLAGKLMSHDPRHFGKGAMMIKTIARKLIDCYSDPSALGQLGLVEATDSRTYAAGRGRKVSGPWRAPDRLAKAYQ